jgi:ABC-type Mn2+/Zn2+ transport system ATPase subunit
MASTSRLSDGGITAIMGPNGAGKSVLIRLLHGLLERLMQGQHHLEWKATAGDATRARQAMVFQKACPAAPVGGGQYRLRAEAGRQARPGPA